MPVMIKQWYNEVIKMDHQWRVTRAEEAFYGKVNQSMQRKPPVAQQASSFVIIGSTKTDIQKHVAAMLVAATATTTSRTIVVRSQCDGCRQRLGTAPTDQVLQLQQRRAYGLRL